MARPRRTLQWNELDVLSRAYGIINTQRGEIKRTGARRAAQAVGRALKSLDGAIRYGQKIRDEEAERG